MSTPLNSPVTSDLNVWVVEDSPEDFEFVERALIRSGPLGALQHFDRAEVAEAALAEGAAPPDLLIVDLHLPGIDGVELVSRIRASHDDALRQLPICVLTSSTRTADIERAKAAGADGYRVKPRRAAELGPLAAYARSLVRPR